VRAHEHRDAILTQPPTETELATAILTVYQGPIEEFVNRRDALVKRLRAEKRPDDAALVKALRKPSRMAWVLNHVVGEDPESIDRLDAAIAGAQTAGDLRTALETVKEAVRGVAAVGARVAVRAGHPLEPNAIATAVYAIIGDAGAFAEFRAGRLVDVPEGGGLDLLVALAPNPASAGTSPPPKPSAPATEPPKEDPRAALAASARVELRRAEQSLGAAREQLEQATASVRDSKARLEAAEQAVVRARSEVEARREDAEHTRRHAESAAANLEEAQRAFNDARARVADFE
jgi:exonuclease VII small subunit